MSFLKIIQGDHGIRLPFTVLKPHPIDLTDAVVKVAIRRSGETYWKQAYIIDAKKGKCELVLTSNDLTVSGVYEYQWTAYLPDGTIFSGLKMDMFVNEKLLAVVGGGDNGETLIIPFATRVEFEDLKRYVDDLVIAGGGSIVVDSDINGNIKVNGQEVIVYDDAGIKQRVKDLEERPSEVSYDDTELRTLIDGKANINHTHSEYAPINHTHSQYALTTHEILTRLGINAEGKLTIDGVVYGGGSTSEPDPVEPTPSIPDNVTNLQASNITETSVTLTWSASSGTTSYDVEQNGTFIGNVTETTYNATRLTSGTSYTFTVKAKNGAGLSSGKTLNITTKEDLHPPETPEVVDIYPYALLPQDPLTEAWICWISDEGSGINHTLEFNGETYVARGEEVPTSEGSQYLYQVKIYNLLPDTEYQLTINNTHNTYYKTLPAMRGANFNFAVTSDLHTDTSAAMRNADEMIAIANTNPNFLAIIGDTVTDGDRLENSKRTQWIEFFNKYLGYLNHSRLIPLITSPGNHDVGTHTNWTGANSPTIGETFYEFFFRNIGQEGVKGKNYGTVTIGDYLHLIAIDTHSTSAQEIGQWLPSAMNTSVDLALSLHHSPMFRGGERFSNDITLESNFRNACFETLSNAPNLKLMFSGHIHVNKRTKPLTVTTIQPSHNNYFNLGNSKYVVDTNITEGIIEFGDGYRHGRPVRSDWYLEDVEQGINHFFSCTMQGNEVVVRNVKKNGEYESETIIPLSGTQIEMPNDVTDLQASNITENSLNLTWTPSTNAVSYDIERNGVFISNVTGTSFNVTNLNPDTQYTFTVKAKNEYNFTSQGVSLTTRTLEPTVEITESYYPVFNGVTSHGMIPHSDNLHGLSIFTLETWIKPITISTTSFRTIIMKTTSSGSTSSVTWGFNFDDTTMLPEFRAGGSVLRTVRAGFALEVERWYHLVGVYNDQANRTEFFIDGLLVGSTNSTGVIKQDSSHNVWISGTSSARRSNNAISNIRFWNRALSSSEIQEHAQNRNKEFTGNENGLVGLWKMNEGSGNTIHDGTSNSNHGTLTNVNWIYG